jgi:hypothetical protein
MQYINLAIHALTPAAPSPAACLGRERKGGTVISIFSPPLSFKPFSFKPPPLFGYKNWTSVIRLVLSKRHDIIYSISFTFH